MMTILEIEKAICEPGEMSSRMEDNAWLKIRGSYGGIEYSRKEMKQVFKELKQRITLISNDLDEATATDRFLLTVLKNMAGDMSC